MRYFYQYSRYGYSYINMHPKNIGNVGLYSYIRYAIKKLPYWYNEFWLYLFVKINIWSFS